MPLLSRAGATLEADGAALVVHGEVGFEVAAELAEEGVAWLRGRPGGSGVAFDLSGVAGVSSAALSVLLEWTRTARAADLRLEAVRLSPALGRLTDLAGLDRLLPLAA
ncbi:STAS domain-containing protein [Halomonas ramblicola]|uniref:STAS domain-containing protein n=1 Tax=Halomonas ramblicola TaxID=747349 RepID=UPI0025B40FCC|nr:STAS domain-containing protein [Halomonas ramblicola]MDN3522383.1 STAS domain-containing protein [Halomonas ramblicola]